MVQLRRRSGRQKVKLQASAGSEQESNLEQSDDDDVSAGVSAESSASADEWRPPAKKSTTQDRRAGRRREEEEEESSSEESEDEALLEEEEEEEELINRTKKRKRGKIVRKRKSSRTASVPAAILKDRSAPIVEEITPVTDEADEDAKREAERLWQDVRVRKANGAQPSATATPAASHGRQNRSASGLDQWLGVQPPEWPSTCPEAMINDRDSLFVGFVYALNAPSQATITQCLSHLTKVVHPQMVPTDRLPPAMRHLTSQRRGATHDMHAWRCLALKKGRTGLAGPEDFGLEEGQEDDGEKFGAKEISKAIRMFGATDVLVIVSRWYGGVMLGPVRFRHIEDCAKAALARHMVNDAMTEFRDELKRLDAQVVELRAKGCTPTSSTAKAATYEDLVDPERAERLIQARNKQIELLSRPPMSSQTSAAAEEADGASMSAAADAQPSRNTREQTYGMGDVQLEEEEAMLQAMHEAEELAASQALKDADKQTAASSSEAEPKTSPPPTLRVKEEPLGVSAVVEGDEKVPSSSLKEERRTPTLQTAECEPAVKEEEDDDLEGWDKL